ncbi:hypothetical protein ABIF78_007718 [Bradyrhizobium japonicum]
MDPLIIALGKRPATAAGDVGVVMLVKTGEDERANVRWFAYRPRFFGDIIRIEWERNTMSVVLPVDVANQLIDRGYAVPMIEREVRDYNRSLEKPEEAAAPPQKHRKGQQSNDQGQV